MTIVDTALLFLILVMLALTAWYHKKIFEIHVEIARSLHAQDSEWSRELQEIKRAVTRHRFGRM